MCASQTKTSQLSIYEQLSVPKSVYIKYTCTYVLRSLFTHLHFRVFRRDSHAPNLCQTHHVNPYPKHLALIFPKRIFVCSPSVTKRRIKTFKMHLVCYLISSCYNFSHNSVFLSVLVFKSHDFSYQYQEQASPTPNIGFSKVSLFFKFTTDL